MSDSTAVVLDFEKDATEAYEVLKNLRWGGNDET